MASSAPFYITTPLYYVNDVPHIGHAYTTLAADMMARFARQQGRPVAFLTGTDEHGQKIQKAAEAKNTPTQDFVDHVSSSFKNLFDRMNISYTHFSRTTAKHHYKAAQALWQRLVENGDIYMGSYKGWYAVRDEAFYSEEDIVDGKAPTGAPVEYIEEPSYFFKLSKWQEPLLAFYKSNPDFIAPESRRNEVMRFVEGGLRDLSVSRTSITWGVPVPEHALKTHKDHVMYVWLDALTGYLSGLGFNGDATGIELQNPSLEGSVRSENSVAKASDVQTFWPNAIHLVGKDILRFHTVYWPAFLLAAGLKPPVRVFAHGWWTKDGEKMSKSLGNVIDPVDMITRYGNDAFRYFVLRDVPFGSDGDFVDSSFCQRVNADLANTYGNLVQRTLAFVYKQCSGKIPTPSDLTEEDHTLLNMHQHIFDVFEECMKHSALHKAIEVVWDGLHAANRYMDHQKPWSLKVSDPKRMETILYVLCEFIRKSAILTQSIVPELSEKILDQLNIAVHARDFSQLGVALKSGMDIKEPKPLVARVESAA